MSRAKTSPRAIASGYVTLFSVAFRHDYYNASGGICPDLTATPAPDTAQLMTSLGMLFKDQGTGFAVLIDAGRIPALLTSLTGTSAGAPGQGLWTRLSFLLAARNPDFIGITNLPITTNAAKQNLYASNLTAVMPGQTIMIGDGEGLGTDALLPVTGASLTVPTPASGAVMLTDISGATVDAPAQTGASGTTFDLSHLPWGRYALAFTGASGKAVQPPRSYRGPQAWLYLPQPPQSLCLLDLLLAQPAAGMGDPAAFPVVPSASRPVAPVHLTVPFAARATYWSYYIVSQARTGRLAPDLQITGKGADFDKSSAALPNGDEAVLFTSTTPLTLEQRSHYHFALAGARQGASGSRDAIRVDRLPVAPPSPVWPSSAAEPLSGSSEMYVYV